MQDIKYSPVVLIGLSSAIIGFWFVVRKKFGGSKIDWDVLNSIKITRRPRNGELSILKLGQNLSKLAMKRPFLGHIQTGQPLSKGPSGQLLGNLHAKIKT